MADTAIAKDAEAVLAGIEGELSVVVQLLRELATDGWEVTPQGLEEVGSMVFATSLRLSTVRSGVVTWMDTHAKLAATTPGVIDAIREKDADLLEAVELARHSVSVIKKNVLIQATEGVALLEECLGLIAALAGAQPPQKPDNVVPLFQEQAAAPAGRRPS